MVGLAEAGVGSAEAAAADWGSAVVVGLDWVVAAGFLLYFILPYIQQAIAG
jgi:hypothetical protein